ncbi:DUF6088 family protein [Spirosoma sp. SC4-14]|uniref:DUF6088 family protein n=1 Tax=Spirosoma sp. SC4-14 TaxID=3128900 RepID=UPI0030CB7D61
MKLDQLKSHLTKGEVYRRADLAQWSKSVDRHVEQLVADGTLQKLAPGMYYVPKETVFGKTPPNEEILVRRFLKDDRFLLTSPNSYNGLGVGTTQLYNKRIVYNHKRHGEFKLGNRNFSFRKKPHFPQKATQEFLLVDLVNNLDTLAEDQDYVLKNVFTKASTMDTNKLKQSVSDYGNVKTKKLFEPFILNSEQSHYAR